MIYVTAVNIKQYYLYIHLSDIIEEAAVFLFKETQHSVKTLKQKNTDGESSLFLTNFPKWFTN